MMIEPSIQQERKEKEKATFDFSLIVIPRGIRLQRLLHWGEKELYYFTHMHTFLCMESTYFLGH